MIDDRLMIIDYFVEAKNQSKIRNTKLEILNKFECFNDQNSKKILDSRCSILVTRCKERDKEILKILIFGFWYLRI